MVVIDRDTIHFQKYELDNDLLVFEHKSDNVILAIRQRKQNVIQFDNLIDVNIGK